MWREYAACVDLNEQTYSWFWGEDETLTAHQQHARARKICFSCPVQVRCLQEALKNDEPWGGWGGFTASQRRRYIAPKYKNNPRREALAGVILTVGGRFMDRLDEEGMPDNRDRLKAISRGEWPPMPDEF